MKTGLYFLLLLIFSNGLSAQVSDFKSIDFTRADNIAELNRGARLDNLPVLAYNLTRNLPTEVEKFRAIYVWVSNNIIGDASQHSKVSNKRKKLRNDSLAFMKWNAKYKKIAFKKLLIHKKTMCTGYAYLIKELCYLARIECVIVDGYGRDVDANVNALEMANHSWNAVKLNKKWYLCDATWSSGYMTAYGVFINDYNNGYFLTDPVLFGKNHFPLEKKWLLNKSLTASNFVNAPLVYSETFTHKIIPVSPQNMDFSIPKNEDITFRFKAIERVLDKNISLVYYVGSREKTLNIYNVKTENDLISFHYKFKHKGNYDTHLKINGDVVATYTIKVTKS